MFEAETVAALLKDKEFTNAISSFPDSVKYWAEAQAAKKEASAYRAKAETATEIKVVFKNLLLAGNKSLEGNIAQTRAQAAQSFQVSKYVAIVGFILIAVGVTIGIISNAMGLNRLDVAYLTSVSGILTEFISGVFFYLYNKTLEQLNRFHDKMLVSQQVVMSLLADSYIDNATKREDTLADLAKTLMSSSL